MAHVVLGHAQLPAQKVFFHVGEALRVFRHRVGNLRVPRGPLDADLEQFLKHRFERAGVPLARVFDNTAIDALRARLTPTEARGPKPVGSLLYPLAVQNVLAAAMNEVAALGMPRVTADLVRSV